MPSRALQSTLTCSKEEHMEQPPVTWCLECGNQLKALFFMGTIHDGYVCESCGLYYSISLRKLAKAY